MRTTTALNPCVQDLPSTRTVRRIGSSPHRVQQAAERDPQRDVGKIARVELEFRDVWPGARRVRERGGVEVEAYRRRERDERELAEGEGRVADRVERQLISIHAINFNQYIHVIRVIRVVNRNIELLKVC